MKSNPNAQAAAITAKLRNGKVKNRYAAKKKLQQIKEKRRVSDWLSQ